jgi:hypothetical protein
MIFAFVGYDLTGGDCDLLRPSSINEWKAIRAEALHSTDGLTISFMQGFDEITMPGRLWHHDGASTVNDADASDPFSRVREINDNRHWSSFLCKMRWLHRHIAGQPLRWW